MSIAVGYSVPPGPGGLGHASADAIAAVTAFDPDVRAYGPRPADDVRAQIPVSVELVPSPDGIAGRRRRRYTWLRYFTGAYQMGVDERLGRWIADAMAARALPDQAYLFTQVASEALARMRDAGRPVFLDNPNGHIRDFREKLCAESERWTGWRYLGHPSEAMVRRVEREYLLADRIRVWSTWAADALARRGVDPDKVVVAPPRIDIARYSPGAPRAGGGPLRVLFVGSLCLRKGFPYLLRCLRRLAPRHVELHMTGATGDPWCRRLLARLSSGLAVTHAPGDPIERYRGADLFVLPTLDEGFGLVVAEAMACGVPVITTDACGAAEWVPEGAGWVVRAGDEDALCEAIEAALVERDRLADMRGAARAAAERLHEAGGRLREIVAAPHAPRIH
ncbi:MAG: glycosyltransferase family 4 protein [Vicinamibacterales bacterium]